VLLVPIALLRNDAEWVKPVLFGLGTAVGITGYAMSALAVGGNLERTAVLVFNSLFSVLAMAGLLEIVGRIKARTAPGAMVRSVVILLA